MTVLLHAYKRALCETEFDLLDHQHLRIDKDKSTTAFSALKELLRSTAKMQRNIMTALRRHRSTGNTAFTAAALDASRATAFQTHRAIAISPHQKFDTGSPSPSTASTQAFPITNLGCKHTGPLRHQQTRHYIKYSGKYSGHMTKTFTNKNGDTVTHKENLDPKDARKIFLSVFIVLGLWVCMWFVLCYEIGNLIGTVFGWIGRGISVLLSWIWWLGCEVFRSLSGRS